MGFFRAPMPQLFLLAAAVNVWVLVLILAGGFAVQLITGELPCPLCMMQRIALMLCAFGPLHILLSARDGALTCRAAAVGNGMAIVAALLGAIASGRQVLLHILPGDPGFGAPVMELHRYTWGLIAFACQIAASAVMLIATVWLEEKPSYGAASPGGPRSRSPRSFSRICSRSSPRPAFIGACPKAPATI